MLHSHAHRPLRTRGFRRSPSASGVVRSRFGAFLLALAVAGALPGAPPAQAQTVCELVDSRNFRRLAAPSGEIVFIAEPRVACDDGSRIRADSAEIFTARNYSQFFGNVRFEETDNILTTDRAHFFSREGRLQAWGSVVLVGKADRSRITGDTLVYLRPTDLRPTEQITVTGDRPHATLYPAPAEPGPGGQMPADTLVEEPDRAAQPRQDLEPVGDTGTVAPPDTTRTPYDVDADRIFLEGERYFRATGDVEIVRDSLEAFADSVEYDQRAGRLLLTGNASLVGEGYTLTGRTVTLVLPGEDIREVVSREDATLIGESLQVTAPVIHLFLEDGVMERMVAVRTAGPPGAEPADRTESPTRSGDSGDRVPPGRLDRGASPSRQGAERAEAPGTPAETGEDEQPQPRAVAEDFVLTADSIEARTPGEILDRVVASGRARGESTSRDSLNTSDTPAVARQDWMEGDTITALFEPVPDSLGTAAVEGERGEYRLDRIRAVGRARSLYRMASDEPAPADSAAAATAGPSGRLSLHYVQGDRILIVMDGGEVREMEVEGQTRGMYLEPRRPSGGSDGSGASRGGGP